MSALGQKQTCAVQNGMSALPPKADIHRRDKVSGARAREHQWRGADAGHKRRPKNRLMVRIRDP